MSKILFPIDFSPASTNAIDFAGNLADLSSSTLVFHHHYKGGITGDSGRENLSKEGIERKLDTLCERVTVDFALPCEYEITEKGSFENSLLQLSESAEIEMVVMGTDGMSNLEQYFRGSYTAKVIDKIKIPLLSVPLSFTDTKIKKMALACDYQEGNDIFIRELYDLAKLYGAEIKIVHISHIDSPMSRELYEVFRDVTSDLFVDKTEMTFERLVFDDIGKGLRKYMRTNGIDLLGMLTKHRGFFDKLFHKSISKEMVMLSEYPILTFHK